MSMDPLGRAKTLHEEGAGVGARGRQEVGKQLSTDWIFPPSLSCDGSLGTSESPSPF